MSSILSKIIIAAALCLGTFGSAVASPFIATFTMGGFESGSPLGTVSGNISWDADSLFGPINQITGVNLSILGHAYSVNELHVVTQTSLPGEFEWNTVMISGVLNDPAIGAAIVNGTDDFWLRWHRDTNEWIDFVYSTSAVAGTWSSSNWDQPRVSQLDISPVAVPEPAAWTLLIAALLTLGAQRIMRRRR